MAIRRLPLVLLLVAALGAFVFSAAHDTTGPVGSADSAPRRAAIRPPGSTGRHGFGARRRRPSPRARHPWPVESPDPVCDRRRCLRPFAAGLSPPRSRSIDRGRSTLVSGCPRAATLLPSSSPDPVIRSRLRPAEMKGSSCSRARPARRRRATQALPPCPSRLGCRNRGCRPQLRAARSDARVATVRAPPQHRQPVEVRSLSRRHQR